MTGTADADAGNVGAYPTHPEGSDLAGYPTFVNHLDKEGWDELSDEQKEQCLDAVPYIREKYPGEELSVALIGTVLCFGL